MAIYPNVIARVPATALARAKGHGVSRPTGLAADQQPPRAIDDPTARQGTAFRCLSARDFRVSPLQAVISGRRRTGPHGGYDTRQHAQPDLIRCREQSVPVQPAESRFVRLHAIPNQLRCIVLESGAGASQATSRHGDTLCCNAGRVQRRKEAANPRPSEPRIPVGRVLDPRMSKVVHGSDEARLWHVEQRANPHECRFDAKPPPWPRDRPSRSCTQVSGGTFPPGHRDGGRAEDRAARGPGTMTTGAHSVPRGPLPEFHEWACTPSIPGCALRSHRAPTTRRRDGIPRPTPDGGRGRQPGRGTCRLGPRSNDESGGIARCCPRRRRLPPPPGGARRTAPPSTPVSRTRVHRWARRQHTSWRSRRLTRTRPFAIPVGCAP